jgi:hypothetical protein
MQHFLLKEQGVFMDTSLKRKTVMSHGNPLKGDKNAKICFSLNTIRTIKKNEVGGFAARM